MADDLVKKLFSVTLEHFQEGDSALDVDVELMIAVASMAAALIGSEPTLAKHRRAVFDDLLSKGIDRLLIERL